MAQHFRASLWNLVVVVGDCGVGDGCGGLRLRFQEGRVSGIEYVGGGGGGGGGGGVGGDGISTGGEAGSVKVTSIANLSLTLFSRCYNRSSDDFWHGGM